MAKKKRKKVVKKKAVQKPVNCNDIHKDEQLEGALMRCMGFLKEYCPEGAIIVQSPSGKWKVLSFGSGPREENFHKVLGNVLTAGVLALEEGPDGAAEWEI